MTVIHTCLTDGTPVCIRRVRRKDEQRLRAGIALLTPQSRYFRFFSGMREPPPAVIDRLISVDDHDHIAWGALRTDVADMPALGVVHAFRNDHVPTDAEFSVAVLDEYHGRGLARMLTAVLLLNCRREGLERLIVHVLAENRAAMALVRSLGGTFREQYSAVAEFDIDIENAVRTLRREVEQASLAHVFRQFRA